MTRGQAMTEDQPEDRNRGYASFLKTLLKHDAQFLIVGSQAICAHGLKRAARDLDVWISASATNTRRVTAALVEFGVPAAQLEPHDLSLPNVLFKLAAVDHLGRPVADIDLLTSVDDFDFDGCHRRCCLLEVSSVRVPVISINDLKRMKKESPRRIDATDLAILEKWIDRGVDDHA